MLIWGNTDVLGPNDQGRVNRSRPTHYDIGMNLGLIYKKQKKQKQKKTTTVDANQYLDRTR